MDKDLLVSEIGSGSELCESLPDTTQTQSKAFQPELIDRLFARFGAMYGARFADMWAANNLDEVKKCWAYELRIFSVEQVGIAVGNLKGHNFPPTLPEFLTLCESARQQKPRRAVYVALPSKSTESNQSEEWHAAKARFMATVKASTPHKPSTEWAVKILRRFESGEHIPAHPIRLAREALQ